eukprot:3904512-Alexandrium_andersonii.AAC.1
MYGPPGSLAGAHVRFLNHFKVAITAHDDSLIGADSGLSALESVGSKALQLVLSATGEPNRADATPNHRDAKEEGGEDRQGAALGAETA